MASNATVVSTTQVSSGAIKSLVLAIYAQAKGLDSQSVFTLTGQALTSIQNTLNSMSGAVNQLLVTINSATNDGATIRGVPVLY